MRAQRSALSASDIARDLDAPLSSTVELLKGMSAVGYVTYDVVKRAYYPSLKFGELGAGILRTMQGTTEVPALAAEVHERCGETTTISSANDLEMEFLHVIQGSFRLTLSIEPGSRLPVFTTAIGRAMLSTLDDVSLANFIKRYQRRRKSLPITQTEIKRQAADDQMRGYVEVYDGAIENVGAIALPFHAANGADLVLSVGGLSERIRENRGEILETMRAAIEAF